MRESPLTRNHNVTGTSVGSTARAHQSPWWKKQTPLALASLETPALPPIVPTAEPIPGLFIFNNFITPEEEAVIMKELDDNSAQPWKFERHTGTHREKRFGIDHDLWSREIRSPKHPIPNSVRSILLPKLMRVAAMRASTPNEVNAIDYRRRNGDFLKSHVNDRKKHSEPIANLSLCGDIYMTYRNTSPHRNVASIREHRILLPKRCLQVMTGKARYDFAHGIENSDLLSDRRVSLTMRETHFGK
jgi:alkylated DNA repair protein alkB family protein 4